jgi:hypothetical protein
MPKTQSRLLTDAYPEIAKEWDSTKNIVTIERVTCKSNKKVWWVCTSKGHSYEAAVSNRTGRNSKCPFCSGSKVGTDNNLTVTHPLLVTEWDSVKNTSVPEQFSKGSHKKAWWICSDGHSYQSAINNRVKGTNCPDCQRMRPSNTYNLAVMYPLLASEWDYSRNTFTPYQITPGSHRKVSWICKQGHTYDAIVLNRRRGTECPRCVNAGHSKVALAWLEHVEKRDQIVIHHAGRGPEHTIVINGNTTTKVDGFCKENNTVYEFHGTYWHGDPRVYSRQDMNKTILKTYGELYDRTITREKAIKQAGYNLEVMWEYDWSLQKKIT